MRAALGRFWFFRIRRKFMTECDDEKEEQEKWQDEGNEQEPNFGESEVEREGREEKNSGEAEA